MATINLGSIKFNWKGAYNSSTAYAVDDVVSSGGNSYVCIQASTGNAVGNATAYWNIMSSAGTNGTNGSNGSDGTDLSTILTTQSDLLYRDGSGLQRLAKGTASQELRMNSGATAPEWHTPAVASSDFEKIGGATFNDVANVQINGSSYWGTAGSYRLHKLVFYDFQPTTDSNMIVRAMTSGSEDSSDKYSRTLTQNNSAGSNHYITGTDTHNEMVMTYDNIRGANRGASKINFEITIGNMIEGNVGKPLMFSSLISAPNQDDESRYITHRMTGGTRTNDACNTNRTGLVFYMTSGNLTGKYVVYGYKA